MKTSIVKKGQENIGEPLNLVNTVSPLTEGKSFSTMQSMLQKSILLQALLFWHILFLSGDKTPENPDLCNSVMDSYIR